MNPLDLPLEALREMLPSHFLTRERLQLLERELAAALNIANVAASAIDREGAFECAVCTPAFEAIQAQAARAIEAIYRACADFHRLPYAQDREAARELYRACAAHLLPAGMVN